MNQRIVKRLRKHILENVEEVLVLIRNEYRNKTENMGPRQIYQNAKKLYYSGKLKLKGARKNDTN